jgi:hypothetical protein
VTRRRIGLGLGLAGLLGLPVASELRLRRLAQPLTEAWRHAAIEPRGATRLGVSVRSPQLDAFGLDARATVTELFAYPFELVRLGAYWNRLEPAPGVFDTAELDWQIDAAERAHKRIILCIGALKAFGYPEYFAPRHIIQSLPERTRIRPAEFSSLLSAATDFIGRIVDRYRRSTAIIAWQVEHEAVDPLGMEHSWRLDTSFVEREVQAARQLDPARPILMNGYLPVSLPVRMAQWWQTRDQGDSLDVAQRLADVIGVDFYPRHAVLKLGPATVYLDASRSPWQLRRLDHILSSARRHGKRVMITEGQAEPWEAVTIPPTLATHAPYSCPPENLIATYNLCLRRARRADFTLDAYLFWGAEYWLARRRAGDTSYVDAFARIITADR